MAKTSTLPAAAPLTGAEAIIGIQGGISVKIPVAGFDEAGRAALDQFASMGMILTGGATTSLINGVQPVIMLGAIHEGVKYSFLACMPDGSIDSPPIEAMITNRLGGLTFRQIESPHGAWIMSRSGPDGLRYVVDGLASDGSSLAGGAAARWEIRGFGFWGQSLSTGDESWPPRFTAPTGYGSLSFSIGIATWRTDYFPNQPELRAASRFDFVPMVSVGVETRCVAFANSYKTRLMGGSRFSTSDMTAGPRIFAHNACVGGRRQSELGPLNDGASGRPGSRPPGGHWPTYLDDIRRAVASAEKIGAHFTYAGWNPDQGEREASFQLLEEGEILAPSALMAGYAAASLDMIQQFDANVRAITSQQTPCPAFITPTAYNPYTPTAWLKVANESPLAFMVGPRFAMTSALNASSGVGPAQRWGTAIHLAPDGQDWVGEQLSKVVHRVVDQGENWKPTELVSVRKVAANQVMFQWHVPRGRLKLDTQWLPKVVGWGITIYGGTVDAPSDKAWPISLEPQDDGVSALATFSDPVPANAFYVIGGEVLVDIGAAMTVGDLGEGLPSPNGFAMHTIHIDGDHRTRLKPLADNGAFRLYSAYRPSECVIRSVGAELVGGRTVLVGETREIRLGGTGGYVPIQIGDSCIFGLAQPANNIRDEDNALSLYDFVDGPRAGQPYPLWNWACTQIGLIGNA